MIVEEQIKFFNKNGYIIVKNYIEKSYIEELKKALYGLRQSSALWYATLRENLVSKPVTKG